MSDINILKRQPSNPGDPNPGLVEGTIKDVPRPGGGSIDGQPGGALPGPGNVQEYIPPRHRAKRPPLIQLSEADTLRSGIPVWHGLVTSKAVAGARKALLEAAAELESVQDAYEGGNPSDRDHDALRAAQAKARSARRAYDQAVQDEIPALLPKLGEAVAERRAEAAKAVQAAQDAVAAYGALLDGSRAAAQEVHGKDGWIPRSPKSDLVREARDGLAAASALVSTNDVALSGAWMADVDSKSIPEWVADLLHARSGTKDAARIALGIGELTGMLPTSYTKRDAHLYAPYMNMAKSEVLELIKSAIS